MTLLYTVTTGGILTAVVIGILVFNYVQLQKNNLQQFRELAYNISSRLQFGSTISGTYLAQTEASGPAIIHIEENEIPLLFTGSWNPKTARAILIDRAKETARLEAVNTSVRPVSSSIVKSSVFTVNGDYSDSYYGMVFVFPTAKGFQSLTLLGLRTPPSAILKKQVPLFLACDLAGIGALLLVSWFFVGHALAPVEQSQNRQARFIAAASHELRSPLAVIESSVSAIGTDPGKQEHYLENIRRECRRMASLVGDMLFLASTDAKNWQINRADVDVDTLMIDVWESHQPLCGKRGIRLDLKLPEDSLPHISADPQRLEQILAILLDNAISYTPTGKSIRLSAREEGKILVLAVTDQGPGVPDQDKERIFERFYRGDQSRNDKKHFGLGLSIAKELAVLHGGTIMVRDSLSANGQIEGSCFEVRLPG